MSGLLARLKQRKLVQWGIAWVAFAFALLQGIDIVATRFDWPSVIERYLILALVIGFFVVLVLAWYHGERGAQRVGGTELLIIALLLAIGGGLIWRFGAVAKTPRATQVASVATASSATTQHAGAKAPADAGFPVPAASIPEKSVAVLPFENDSGSRDQQYFSDGLSGDLITTLSQFAGLKVINRDSSFQFRDSKDSVKLIAQKLGVAHLLEGSVQKQGDEVRITATLVYAADGTVVWSQRYEKPYKDLFALQDDITQSVAAALKAKLLTAPGAVVQSDRPPSGDLAAYAAYLQARSSASQGNGAGLHAAIEALDKAVQLDPRYAAAYAMLGDVWTARYRLSTTGADKQQAAANARAAIRTALDLNADLAAAHANHSYMLASIDLDWNGALAECRKALLLAPHDTGVKGCLADAFATHGQLDEAIGLARDVLKTDPRGATGWHWLGHYLFAIGRLDEAEQATHKQIELAPQSSDSYQQLAVIEVLRGNAEAAMRWARQEPSPGWRRFAVALAAQIGPDRAAGDAALQDLIAHAADTMTYQIAEVYGLRRDPDAMFKWLDRAWTNRDSGIGTLLYTPFILRYQHDRRFAAFCKKVGLPTTTDAKPLP